MAEPGVTHPRAFGPNGCVTLRPPWPAFHLRKASPSSAGPSRGPAIERAKLYIFFVNCCDTFELTQKFSEMTMLDIAILVPMLIRLNRALVSSSYELSH